MHKGQLVKAFQLLKEGEKNQAAVIVKGILREDPKNLNAWWLMSHLLEDEDELVKALERVLTIDPNHSAARTRLAKLRPEYGNLVSEDIIATKQSKKDSAKADSDYWNKLDKGPIPTKNPHFWRDLIASRFGRRITIGVIVLSLQYLA